MRGFVTFQPNLRLRAHALAAGLSAVVSVAACSPPADASAAADALDARCEAIGNSSATKLQPADRRWLLERCDCFPQTIGCSSVGSRRYWARMDAYVAAEEDARRRRAAAEETERRRRAEEDAQRRQAERAKVASVRKATVALRRAFWACSDSLKGQDCSAQYDALFAACRSAGVRAEWLDAADDCFRP